MGNILLEKVFRMAEGGMEVMINMTVVVWRYGGCGADGNGGGGR